MDSQKNNIKKFGTFAGVFTPTLLTILGVIMCLRMGWVVGHAPSADLNTFGMDENLRFDFVKTMTMKTESSCLFVKDSGHESTLA